MLKNEKKSLKIFCEGLSEGFSSASEPLRNYKRCKGVAVLEEKSFNKHYLTAYLPTFGANFVVE